MAWTSDGLLLVCVLKQGSLCILPHYGQPVKLITHGCSMDMGPAYFLPLHPLISSVSYSFCLPICLYVCLSLSIYLSTYLYLSVCLSLSLSVPYLFCSLVFDSLCCCFTCRKSQESTLASSLSSSERDVLRQRFSVATHPFYPVLLCSDGYMVSTMSLSATFSLVTLVNSLVSGSRALAGLSPLIENLDTPSHHSIGLKSWHHTLSHSSGLADTMNSSYSSWQPLGAAGTSSGVLHFAGLDEDLDQTSKALLEADVTTSKARIGQSLSMLLTAWSIFVSDGLNSAGNGVASSSWPASQERQEGTW